MEHKISVVEEKKAKTKPGGAYLLLDLLGWAADIAAAPVCLHPGLYGGGGKRPGRSGVGGEPPSDRR